MFMDRMQEKINLFFREKIGHVVRPAHDAKMLSLALGIGNLADIKQAVKEMDGTDSAKASVPFNEQVAEVGEVYSLVRVKIDDMELWNESRDLRVGQNPASMGPVEQNICKSPNDEPIRAIVIRQRSLGEQRVQQYFEKFYLETQHIVARKETLPDGIPMHRLLSHVKDYEVHRSRKTTLAMSVIQMI